MLVAGVVLLPIATVLSGMLLGYAMGYMREKPKPGSFFSVVLVGVLTGAFLVSGITLWLYMHSKYGWFIHHAPGKLWDQAWFWPVVWIIATYTSFEVPRRQHRKEKKKAQPVPSEN
jgi:NADH:ubiquinone oxidoreductase subunit 5 (subunit L)/multisubunit Na+/H+ antiporter MnhA subunit